MNLYRPLHHGVLPHKNYRVTTETLADILELIRADVIGGDDENLAIVLEQLAELGVVVNLLLSLGELAHL